MKKIFLFAAMLFCWGQANCSQAYTLQELTDTPIANDFVLGPGKVDLDLLPGEKTTQQITVTNRLGKNMNFKVNVEDFSGSYDTDETVKLFGDIKGPYSMKDYIRPETYEFSLKHGERIILPVEINIPKNSQPGGLYASVLVATSPDDADAGADQAQAKVISRLGTLYFVKVAGAVNESGRLQSFRVSDTKSGFYEKGPVNFEVYFKNEGNIHLIPSGRIEIRNMLGKNVGEVNVEKYFVMPDSLRKINVSWDSAFLMGRYTAVLTLDNNYQEKPKAAETLEVSFWVIPWRILLGATVILLALLWLIRSVMSRFRFEIRKK